MKPKKGSPMSNPSEDLKFQAEAEQARAEARYHNARATEAEYAAEAKSLNMEQTRFNHSVWKSSDALNRTYRFSSSVGPKSVSECQDSLLYWHRQDKSAPVEIIFNSPGGSIFDGMALYDFIHDLRAAGTPVTTGTFGMAASMAGILLQAGDHRWMSPQSWLLIHRASFGAGGSTFDVEDQLELIHKIEGRILDIFHTRSGGKADREMIRENWKRKDWWLTPEEAMSFNLVDSLRGVVA